MQDRGHLPLPGVDSTTAPEPDDPGYAGWVERTTFSPEGVDRGLIWAALRLTPAERLQRLQDLVDGLSSQVHGKHAVR